MRAYLSLGSNQGDRLANLRAAMAAIAALPGTAVTAQAPVYETKPVDVPFPEPDYYNTAALVETTLSPEALSDAVHAIEAALGRVRDGTRHTPRPIDVDLVACDGIRCDSPSLRLPHPEAARRRFVLQPLADIDPGYTLPGQTQTVSELLAALPPGDGGRLVES